LVFFIFKRELALKLSPKEIQRARETFYSFDRDKGGTISDDEARRTLRHWFTFLHRNRFVLLAYV
jgi:Ca2+-binding EF-hand superfamily protein